MSMIRVSVGVPVYNGEKYLAQALGSLLAQSFKDFEIIISDNASTDRTAEISRAYEAKDPRIRYYRNDQNIGAALNFNRAFERSSAPLFHGGACDDLYEPRFLERCVDVLERRSDVVLSHSRAKVIGDHGEPLLYDQERNRFIDSHGDLVMSPEPCHIGETASPESRFREVLWFVTWCLPVSGVIRRQALLRTSLHGNYYGADKVLLAELALQGRFYQIEEELFIKRIHRGCTFYQSTHDKAAHDSAEPRGIPQLKMLRDYIKMVWAADVCTRQRLHCLATVAGMTRRHGLWRRLLVPGPDNYLGLSFGGR
jgi:glycosyltransferase involved in cell wall biosynthesis